jgi:hypothetical protein
LFVRLAVVALAAFLVGAVVQRAFLGDFALKMGPVELPDLRRAAAASERALAEITDELKRQADATRDAMKVAADAADGVAAIEEENHKLRLNLQELISALGPGDRDDPPT